jgi:hypothetical protein
MINNITNLRINTVLLEQVPSTSGAVTDNTIYVSTSLDISNTKRSIEQYNLRLFVSLTQESSRALDFLSQRYNEFLNGRAGSTHPDQFSEFLNFALGEHAQYLSNNHPFSPFSTNNEIRDLVITDGLSHYGQGDSIPEGIIIYDMPLSEMLDGIKVDKNILNTIKMTLPPTSDSLDQISCYAFLYDNRMAQIFSDEPEFNLSLSTGMGHIATGSFRGIQTRYAETFPDKPLVAMVNPEQTTSPDSERFRVINSSTDNAVAQTYTNIFNGVVALFQTPYLTQSHELNKVIKRSNYFTDFWLSRDLEDNNRFVFSFDIRQFLIDHAIFPFVYKSSLFSKALLSGADDLSPEHLSSVATVQVMRNKVSSHGMYPVNDLGTIGKGYPDRETLPLPTEDIKEVKINLPSGELSDISQDVRVFFEGCDKFSKPQIIDQQTVESYQYSVDLSVVDHSPLFLRHMVKVLNEQKRIISHIRDIISMSTSTMFGRRPLFNVQTGRTSTDVRSIQINIDNKSVQVGEEITRILSLYQEILNNMSVSGATIDLVSYYQNLFDKDQGIVSTQAFTDIEFLLDMGVIFFYNKLVNIFPSDPLGAMDSIAKNNFNKNMTRSVRDNVMKVSHRYYEMYTTGKNNSLGVDYVFGETAPMGFSNITVDGYDDRRIMEFNKYFFNPSGGGEVIPGGTYENLSYSYLTPRLIKSPSRSAIDQVRVPVSTPQAVDYDFNRYSQLYSDLISIRKQQDLGVTYPTLSGEAQEQSKNNKLYSDIRKMLTEEMGVFLSDEPSSEFSPPRVTTEKKRITTYNPKDKEFCASNAGPDLVSSVIGGGSNITSSVGLYLDSVNLEIKNQNTQLITGDIEQTVAKEALKERTIKIPFAILGELTIDKTLNQLDRGIKSRYNSMKALPEILKINQNNLVDSIEGPMVSSLPLQLQSMIILATTNSPLSVAATSGDNVLDARRFILNNLSESSGNDLVSFFIKGEVSSTEESNLYGLTPDPMKSYDTFLALWMNYRQIAVVEYLNGFGDIEQPNEQLEPDISRSRLQLAQWSALSSDVVGELRDQGGKILCRVRNLGANDYLNMVSQFTTPDQQVMLSRYFEEKQLLNIPTYNKYFYISNETPQVEGVMRDQDSVTEPELGDGITTESFAMAQQSESDAFMTTQQVVTGY